jgi:hypothetical protein
MKHIDKTRRLFLPAALLTLALGGGLSAQTPQIAVSGAVDWKKMEMTVNLALGLSSMPELRLPGARARAEDIFSVEFTGLARPFILALPVDSSTSVGDLVTQGNFPFLGPEIFAGNAVRDQTIFTPDFSVLSTAYTLDLTILSSQLIPHNQPLELPRIIAPRPAASYSGIIIIALGELPVHGKKTGAQAAACLFPRIWDSQMNLVYERNILDPENSNKILARYASEADIFQDNPSGLSPEIIALVGENPLKLLAQGVFGVRPTDPIIDREDALIILSSETNRRLLREGKVVIILGEDALKATFGTAP